LGKYTKYFLNELSERQKRGGNKETFSGKFSIQLKYFLESATVSER
jgi:hypothetical protein